MIVGLIKQILTNVDDRQIATMRNLGKYVCHKLVDGIREIVNNQQGRSSSVEYLVPFCRKSFVEVHERSVMLEHRLIFPITIEDAWNRLFEKQIIAYCIQHTQYESSLSTLCAHLLKMSIDV